MDNTINLNGITEDITLSHKVSSGGKNYTVIRLSFKVGAKDFEIQKFLDNNESYILEDLVERLRAEQKANGTIQVK